MRKTRILPLLLALCLLLTLLPVSALAQTAPSYVALGDSIAAGFGLEGYTGQGSTPAGGFPTLVAQELGDTLTDLAVSGFDTQDLLEAMQTAAYADAIKNADLVTLTIGSNDLLTKTIVQVMAHLGMDQMSQEEIEAAIRSQLTGGDMTQAMAQLQSISDYFNSAEFLAILDAAIPVFQANWNTIMETLQAWNPDMTLLVTNFYNPYAAFDLSFGSLSINIGTLGQSYLDQMNNYITQSPYNGSFYTIVDITEVTTNVKLNVSSLAAAYLSGQTPDLSQSINLDPHPDAEGHQYIARQVLSVLQPVSFPDVAADAWYYDQVSYAAQQGLVVGDAAGNFDPEGTMTIAQYMTVLYRYARAAAGASIPEKQTTGDGWLGAASWINDHLLDGRFADLSAPMTRYEMAAITANVLRAVSTLTGKTVAQRETHGFTDVSLDSDQYADVAYLESVYGIDGTLQADGSYTFDGGNAITRCQVATVVYNIMTKSAA